MESCRNRKIFREVVCLFSSSNSFCYKKRFIEVFQCNIWVTESKRNDILECSLSPFNSRNILRPIRHDDLSSVFSERRINSFCEGTGTEKCSFSGSTTSCATPYPFYLNFHDIRFLGRGFRLLCKPVLNFKSVLRLSVLKLEKPAIHLVQGKFTNKQSMFEF